MAKKTISLLYGADNASVQLVIDGITQPDVYKWRNASMAAVKKLFEEDKEITKKNAESLYDQILVTEGMPDDEDGNDNIFPGDSFGPLLEMLFGGGSSMTMMSISGGKVTMASISIDRKSTRL